MIRAVQRAGIGICSHIRERRISDFRAPDAAQREALRGAVRCRAGAPVTCYSKQPGSRFCEAALRKGCALHRARETRAVHRHSACDNPR
jgi:hypothetical protein